MVVLIHCGSGGTNHVIVIIYELECMGGAQWHPTSINNIYTSYVRLIEGMRISSWCRYQHGFNIIATRSECS